MSSSMKIMMNMVLIKILTVTRGRLPKLKPDISVKKFAAYLV